MTPMEIAQKLRGFLATSSMGTALSRTGIARPLLRAYERRILRRGRHSLSYGSTVTFAVHERLEVRTIDAFRRMEGVLIDRIRVSLRPDDTVLDVGAHMGIVSLLLAAAAPSGVVVHAIEPNPETARRTRESVALNPGLAVTVHELALGRENGPGSLHLHDGDNSCDSMLGVAPGYARRRIAIRVERADDFARRFGVRPAVVKIDVEGAEVDVLLGMEGLLRNTVREVFVEVHPKLLVAAGYDEGEPARILESCGFRRVWSTPRRTETHEQFRRNA